MSILRLTIEGLVELEGRELEESLSRFEVVQEIKTHSFIRELHAAAEPDSIESLRHVIVYLLEFSAITWNPLTKSFLETIGKKSAEDFYAAGKSQINAFIKKWSEDRNAESKKERIRFI